jgi:hypothetical protein
MFLSSGKTFKSFADQRCLSFECDLSLSNTSGNSSIGVTRIGGVSGIEVSLFNFQSGKMMDSTNNFVYSYSANDNIKISGNVCSGLFGYFVNDKPIRPRNRLCSTCFTTTTLDNFFVSTTGTNVTFSLDLKADLIPSVSIQFPFAPYKTGENISGYLINNNSEIWRSFKVFSGRSSFYNNLGYKINNQLNGNKIAAGSSGLFLIEYDFSDNRFSVNENGEVADLSGILYFETDFGAFEKEVFIPLYKSPNYSIDVSAGFTGFNSPTSFSWSYILSRQACSGASYEITVKKDFWVDDVPLSGLVTAETGQFLNGRTLQSSSLFFNQALDQYKGTGFIPASGCLNTSFFEISHSIFYNFINIDNKNQTILSLSGITEPFFFERIF